MMSRSEWKRRNQSKAGNPPSDRCTVDIIKGNYISRIYFATAEGMPLDLLATLWRKLPDGFWTLTYRFRYYKDGLTHGSEDVKRFYTGTWQESISEAEAAAKVDEAMQGIAQTAFNAPLKIDATVISSDEPEVVYFHMRQKPYFHIQAVSN